MGSHPHARHTLHSGRLLGALPWVVSPRAHLVESRVLGVVLASGHVLSHLLRVVLAHHLHNVVDHLLLLLVVVIVRRLLLLTALEVCEPIVGLGGGRSRRDEFSELFGWLFRCRGHAEEVRDGLLGLRGGSGRGLGGGLRRLLQLL